MSAPTAASSSTRQTSDRRRHDESGTNNNNLNPRRIQTGLPGIRRTVYDGALRVNSDAYDVLSLTVRDVHNNTTAAVNSNSNNDSSDGDDNMMSLQAKPEWRKHFPLNALLRPSINSTSHNAFHIPSNNKRRDTILITELTNQTVVTHQPRIVNAATGERAMCAVEGVVTVSRNLEVAVLDAGLMEEEEENGQEGAGSVGEAVVSIRGGGEGDGDVVMEESKKEDVDMSEAPVNNAIEGGTSAGGGVDNNAVIASSSTAATTPAATGVGGGSNAAVETKPVEAVAPVPSAQSGGEIKVAQEQQPTTAAVAAATTTTTTDDKSQVVSSTDVVGQQSGVADVATSSNTTQVATNTAVAAASAPAATAPTAAIATSSSSSGVATTTTATATTPSTNQPKTTTTAAPVPTPEATTVKSTTIHPLPQNHPPLSTSIILPTTTTINTPPQNAPSWYHPTKISTTEKSSLPEWFNSSAPHRTPVTYLSTRNQILNIYQAQLLSSNTTAASTTTNTTTTSGGTTTVQHQQQYLTPTAIRRCVPGDVGSLLRLHTFLCDWGLINGKDLGENAPSDLALRGGNSNKGKRKLEDVQRSVFWSKERLEELDGVVVKYVKVTQTTVIGGGGVVEGVPQQQQQPSVDWDAVAKDIGDGVSAADCQRAFLDPPPNDEVSVKIAKTSSSSSGFDLTTILDGVHPDVLQATINASLKATNDITEARKASIAGILASTAATKAHSEEEEIARTLMDILDQRMQRLENRVAILDDVEALLEAERVALELERRDMYTTRCRHWFGDGSS
eukprot:scaffold786_cov91-Skeletonema_dohrnii-CCMP3373.AAC.5